MAFPSLITNRLKLVEINHNHVDSLYEILSLEEVTRYYGTDRFTYLGEASRLIDMFHKNFYEKRGIRWGIILKENQKFIGTIGLNALQMNNKRAEIGYELHPAYWRKGYISEAIKEVLRFSFEIIDLNRIGAVVYPENEPSLKLLMKIGFEKEGLLRGYIQQNNQFHDTYVLSLLKYEWENRQKN
ncbi:GNAT family N-acetyltransferase [Neobacillus massiliamazoniensis]|jgi:ribosomal-protein-alanine N-acetyltransferase|uniref:Acetyltransferase, GNAT family n=1 Tax=Neobacillus massiliamazoniensis TaxID=1499688 RepID=A0A0U1NRR2_9BACI|nr:GNAT family N-acetyltransferase [Neobacillus massiliamazoniensis]CRK80438.1 acetyltransferase, GNAT family [Neobacillus massiliamazoniensis]